MQYVSYLVQISVNNQTNLISTAWMNQMLYKSDLECSTIGGIGDCLSVCNCNLFSETVLISQFEYTCSPSYVQHCNAIGTKACPICIN